MSAAICLRSEGSMGGQFSDVVRFAAQGVSSMLFAGSMRGESCGACTCTGACLTCPDRVRCHIRTCKHCQSDVGRLCSACVSWPVRVAIVAVART